MILIKKRPFVQVYLYPESQLLIHQWERGIDESTFEEQVEEMLETYADLKQDYADLKWMCDNTKQDEEGCAAKYWQQPLLDEALAKAGLNQVAVVMGRRRYEMQPQKELKRQLPNGSELQINLYGDRIAAENWLKEGHSNKAVA